MLIREINVSAVHSIELFEYVWQGKFSKILMSVDGEVEGWYYFGGHQHFRPGDRLIVVTTGNARRRILSFSHNGKIIFNQSSLREIPWFICLLMVVATVYFTEIIKGPVGQSLVVLNLMALVMISVIGFRVWRIFFIRRSVKKLKNFISWRKSVD